MKYQTIIRLFIVVLAITASTSSWAQDKAIPETRQQVQMSFAPLVKKVAPAVVNIYTKHIVSQREQVAQNPFINDPFFSQFFKNDMFGGQMRQQVANTLGSGVIVAADGLVVTNAHVIRDADEIKVALLDGREFDAKVVLKDDPSDLALLRFDAKGEQLPYVTLKPSEQMEVGDLVLAIGNPFGVGQTVTSGIISALARSSLDISNFNFFIQTDAAINPGNSGGPLVALDGGVVGINSAIYSQGGGSIGIGFAIPSEMVASVIAAEKTGEKTGVKQINGVTRPWLGVSTQNITSEIATTLGMSRPTGVLVAALHSASPMAKAGIQVGDVMSSINGHELHDSAEAKFRMATIPLGQKANFDVIRKGAHMTFQVEAIAPPDIPPRNETPISGDNPLNGATIANLNPAVAVVLGGANGEDKGVVVLKIQEGSDASRIFTPGDIIVQINSTKIDSVAAAQKALMNGAPHGWSLILKRQGRTTQIVIH